MRIKVIELNLPITDPNTSRISQGFRVKCRLMDLYFKKNDCIAQELDDSGYHLKP